MKNENFKTSTELQICEYITVILNTGYYLE